MVCKSHIATTSAILLSKITRLTGRKGAAFESGDIDTSASFGTILDAVQMILPAKSVHGLNHVFTIRESRSI